MERKELKKLIKECLGELLTESVTVSVSGAHLEFPELDTIHDIIWAINYKAFQPLSNLSGQEKRDFEHIRMPEIFAPDGNDFDKPTGTINFYIRGIPPHAVEEVLKLTKEQLDNLGIEYGRFKPELNRAPKSDVIRIPILKNPWVNAERPPELNMSNRNYHILFHDVLNLVQGEEQWGGSLPIETIEQAIQPLVTGSDIEQMQALQSYSFGATQSAPNFYESGLSVEQLSRYINALKQMIDWAKAKGYKSLSWG